MPMLAWKRGEGRLRSITNTSVPVVARQTLERTCPGQLEELPFATRVTVSLDEDTFFSEVLLTISVTITVF
jgi:hypothetical protein